MQVNFRKYAQAQDMISLIMKEKNLSAEEAVSYAISKDSYVAIRIKKYGYYGLAFWGHDNEERKWNVLDKPVLNLQLSEMQEMLLADIETYLRVTREEAISYFLVFTMESLGYHI